MAPGTAAWHSAALPPTCGRCRCDVATYYCRASGLQHRLTIFCWHDTALASATAPLSAPASLPPRNDFLLPPVLPPYLRALQEEVAVQGHRVLTPLVSLDTPGKATVQVVILADPDGHEVRNGHAAVC